VLGSGWQLRLGSSTGYCGRATPVLDLGRSTQEMLDFCAEREIASEIEVIPIQKVNEVYERMLKSDVKYRFVIDLATLA
jgi:hypothetical protein